MNSDIAGRRLQRQLITREGPSRPADAVAWLGAVQAQEYEAAKWGLALRMRDGAVDADIERAFNRGSILRTHVMRPTWHFVTPADISWLLELTAPRVHRVMASYNRRLELDARTLTRGASVIERALGDRRCLTRKELGERLQRAGMPMAGQRLAHLVVHAELERIVCSGPRRGKHFTYALLAERAPGGLRLSRDDALAKLTRRFFTSHGPATIRDFVWWSGLTVADARRGLDINKARRAEVGALAYWTIGESPRGAMRDRLVHLLPIYDEYLVAYRDREAVPHRPSVIDGSSSGPVSFWHALVIAGQVAGTWRSTRTPLATAVDATPLRRLTGRERTGLAEEVRRFERFLSAPVEFSIHDRARSDVPSRIAQVAKRNRTRSV